MERLCARQQATIQRQAALLKQKRDRARSVNAEIRRLEARVRQLEERLSRNSANSSQPPSEDGPEVVRLKHRRSRKRGGRHGHKGRSRPLVPANQVDAIVDCKPDRCCARAHLLTGDDLSPWRHQVSEIPELRIEITEYRRHHLSCPNCSRVTIGALPEGVSHSSFGPRLHALTSLLTGRFLLSKRDVVTRYNVVYGLQLGASRVIAMERRMPEALADPVQEALEFCPLQSSIQTKPAGDKPRNVPGVGRRRPRRSPSSTSIGDGIRKQPRRFWARTSRAQPAPIASVPKTGSSAGATAGPT